MELQSTTVKGFELYGDLLHVFSAAGVDVYRLPWLDRRIAWAALTNVTCGTVNDGGIYLGTSDRGVWWLPHGREGASSGSLVNVITDVSSPAIADLAVNGLAGFGDALLVTTDAGADFFVDPLTRYSYTDAGGCGAAAISDDTIAYAVTSGLHVLAYPSADWDSGDATVLTTGSSPAIIGNTVQALRFGTDLFIGTSVGLSVYDGTSVTNRAAPTTAAASSITTDVGTPSGDVADIQAQDSVDYTITEVTGTPGFRTEIGFTSATALTSVNIRGYYGGNSGHTVNVNLYNFTTASWDTLGTLPDASSDGTYTFTSGITDANHRDTDGSVRVQIEHTSSGNVTHALYLDRVWIGITAATVNDVRSVWPQAGATRTAGFVGLGYADDADGGRCEIYDLALLETVYQDPGDSAAVWLEEDAQALLCDAVLEAFVQVIAISPGRDAREVRTDWAFYAELLDLQDGIAPGSVTMLLDGASVSPTLTAITGGYSVVYAPPSASAYAKRHVVTLAFTDGDGHAVSRSWSFTVQSASTTQGSDSAPPNVVAIRDVGLDSDEADELVDTVPVIWAEEIVSALIVNDDQAQAVATGAIDEGTYHRHLRTVTVLRTDANGDETLTLVKGDLVALTIPAIGMSAKTCEVLSAQRQVAKGNDDNPQTVLTVAYYEQVTP